MTNPGYDWRSISASTSALLHSFKARVARVSTDLSGFIREERLDRAEAEIVAALQELRELRVHVRQMRAEAKSDRRAYEAEAVARAL